MKFVCSFLLVLLHSSIIICQETCELNTNCSNCTPCLEPSECNFYNIFCQKENKYYDFLQDVYTNLSFYYRNDPEINSFCNSRVISLSSMQNSFVLLESSPDKLNSKSNKLYNCEYVISNDYYLNHETDQAKIVFEIKKNSPNITDESKLKFDIIFLLTSDSKQTIGFDEKSDDSIREIGYTYYRYLDGYSEIEIFINFYNDNIGNIGESLVVNIETLNPSQKLRYIYLVVIIILSFFILAIIVLIIVYFFMKRKMIRDRERMLEEEQRKQIENQKLIEKFLKEELKPQKFNENLNINDNDMCTICYDKFIIGESEVSVTPCSHVFHHACIEKWVKEKITNPLCPNCKFSFLKYAENPSEKMKNMKMNINKNNKSKENNINDINGNKKDDENNPSHSENIRINVLPMADSNDNNNNINNNIEGSVDIVVEE